MIQSSTLSTTNTPTRVILHAGLIAGTLDILAAFTHAYLANGTAPLAVLRYVASGVLGKAAFTGGLPMALAGLLFHYIVATGWAAIFYLLYPTIRKVSTNWVLNGLLYGFIVWSLMAFVVVPLSGVPARPFKVTPQTFISVGIIMLFVGLPISRIVSQKYANR